MVQFLAFQQQTAQEIRAVYEQIPLGVSNRQAALDILSRYLPIMNTPTNLSASGSLSEDEMNILSDVFLDQPDLVVMLSNVVADYGQRVSDLAGTLPITDGGTFEYPDSDDYYQLTGGPVHVTEHLVGLHASAEGKAAYVGRGFSYVMHDLAHFGYPWWFFPEIRFFMDSPESDSDARRSRITASLATMQRATGVRLRMLDRGPVLFRRLRYRMRVLFWRLNLFLAVRIRIMNTSTPGRATVGCRFQPYVIFDPDTADSDDVYYECTRQHETGHVLGMLHEHQRPDRDQYINMDASGDEKNLGKIEVNGSGGLTTMYNTLYDYNSLMHYHPFGFPNYWITVLNPAHEARANRDYRDNLLQYGDWNGQSYLTPWDIYTVRAMYQFTPNPRPGYSPGTDFGYTISYGANGGNGDVPHDQHFYAAGYTVPVAEPENLSRPGYAFGGWSLVIAGRTNTCWPGRTFLMPEENAVLRARWVTLSNGVIYHRCSSCASANWWIRYKYPEGEYSGFPGEPMQAVADGWYRWYRDTVDGPVTVEFFSSTGRRDSEYMVLSNTAWIENGQVHYQQPE